MVKMKIVARLEWQERDERRAKAVMEALEPCNKKAPPGVMIHTFNLKRKVVTEIKMREGRLETLIATLDDLLACASVARKILET